MQIYKYTLIPWTADQSFTMPLGAKILTAQWQNDDIAMWVQVNNKEPTTEVRRFSSFATGEELPDNPGKYIATVQNTSTLTGTVFVHHIFEAIENENI